MTQTTNRSNPRRAPRVSATAALSALLSLAVAWTSANAARAETVHTDISRTYTCEPVTHGVLAATDGGVALFDRSGRVQRTYTALDGLAGTRSYTLLVEGQTLWIGGERGLTRARMVESGLRVEARYEAAPVRALLRHDGALYAGTWGGGVMRLAGDKLARVPTENAREHGQGQGQGQGTNSAANPASRITALAAHGDGLVVATAGRGLYRLDGRGGRARVRPMDVEGLDRRAMVWSLIDRDDTLLVGTVTGLFAVQDGRADKRADGDVRALAARHGQVVATLFGGGLAELGARGLASRTDLPEGARFAYSYASAPALAGDHPGTDECLASHDGLWLRTAHDTRWRAAAVETLPSGDIAALAVDGERLWVGTFDSGLAVLERGQWRSFEHPRIDPKINVIEVAHGRVWVGTSAGLSVIEGERVTRVTRDDGLPSSFIMSLAALDHGGMLVGTAHGAAVLRDGAIEVIGRKQGVYIGNVWAVAQDSAGRMILGTTKGLYRVSRDLAFERFSVASGHLRDDWVMAIERVGDTLFVGTYKGGVTRLEPTVVDTADPSASVDEGVAVEHLGGGFVNPGGLTWHDGRLHAATMDGLLVGDGHGWSAPEVVAPGRDTTAVVAQARGAGAILWIASRRGLRAME